MTSVSFTLPTLRNKPLIRKTRLDEHVEWLGRHVGSDKSSLFFSLSRRRPFPYGLVILDSSFPLSNESVQNVRSTYAAAEMYWSNLFRSSWRLRPQRRCSLPYWACRSSDRTTMRPFIWRFGSEYSIGMTEMPTLVEGPSFQIQPAGARVLATYVFPIAPWSYSRLTFCLPQSSFGPRIEPPCHYYQQFW